MAQDWKKDGGIGPQGLGDYPELHSEQDMLAWKREYNIRQREADWKKRQDEVLMQKQVAWEVAKLEKENRLAAAREGFRRQRLEDKIKVRHEQVQREYCDRCRTIEVENRFKKWEDKENKQICDQVKSSKQEAMVLEAQRGSEKSLTFSKLREAAQLRTDKKQADADKNAQREENMRKKELARQQRELERTKALKKDDLAERAQRVAQFTDKQIQVSSSLASILTQNPGAAESEMKAAIRNAKIEASRAAKGGAKAAKSA
jgi:hypothetical protein